MMRLADVEKSPRVQSKTFLVKAEIIIIRVAILPKMMMTAYTVIQDKT